jgi:hypothetical protein
VAKEKDIYDIGRYFLKDIPADVSAVLEVEGVRPIKAGSKFKAHNERGLFTFLYIQAGQITCFDPQGQFRALPISKVKRSVNPSKREKAAKNAKKAKV